MRGLNYLLGSLILVICVKEYLTDMSPPIITTLIPDGMNSTETECTNSSAFTLLIPTEHHYTEENITVSTIRSKSLLSIQILTEYINNKEMKSMVINKTTIVTIETKTVTPSDIHIKTTNSISPSIIRVLIGSGAPEILNNQTNPATATAETTTPNTENLTPDSYCSTVAQTNTTTESLAIAGTICSKISSSSASTTITTTEEVIVLGSDGSSKSCTYY